MSNLTPEDLKAMRAVCDALPKGEPNVHGPAIIEFVNDDMVERLSEAGDDRYPEDADAAASAFLFGWNQSMDAHAESRAMLPRALDEIERLREALSLLPDVVKDADRHGFEMGRAAGLAALDRLVEANVDLRAEAERVAAYVATTLRRYVDADGSECLDDALMDAASEGPAALLALVDGEGS